MIHNTSVSQLLRISISALAIFLGVSFGRSNLHAQDKADSSAPVINLEYTYAVFGTDENFLMKDGVGIVEFSFSFPESSVFFGTRDRGVLVIEGEFRNRADGDVSFFIWPMTIARDTSEGGRWITALERIELPAGEYSGVLRVYNAGRKEQADSTHTELEVPDFRRTEFSVADIELITARVPATGERHRFRRGSDVLFRNVGSVIAPPDYYLHAYTELYNTDRLVQRRYHLYWVITDTAGRALFSIDTVVATEGDSVEVVTQSFQLGSAQGGEYYLLLRVYDGNRLVATDSASAIRSFFLYKPEGSGLASVDGSDTRESVIDPMFSGLTEAELDIEFRKASYIIPEHQQKIFEGLSGPEAKGRFLTNFWNALDDDPRSPEHPVRDEYYERVTQASNFYRSSLTPRGWDSDRGRVLLKYGAPDGIDRHPNDFNRRPFEIWRYSASRLTFVFVDVSQTGNYLMVHSTAPGEIRNQYWEREHAQMHDDPNEESALDQRGRIFGD